MVTQFTQKEGESSLHFTKTDHRIVSVKKNLPCDKACDIVIPMHFDVHKNKILDYFCHFFYAVEQSLALFSSHR